MIMDMEKVTVIDFHAHILPGLDHGCESLAIAKKQLELAAEAGINIVVATSHFYPHLDTVEGFVRAREFAMKELKKASFELQNCPQIISGAEVLVCKGMERMEGLEKLCVDGTKVLLLEMPFTKRWESSLVDSVCKTAERFQVVLAHADRYPYATVNELIETGCLIQLNADAICSWKKRKLCRNYLKTGAVAALGSDIHGTKTGYQQFKKAQKHLGETGVQIMKKTAILCRKDEAKA